MSGGLACALPDGHPGYCRHAEAHRLDVPESPPEHSPLCRMGVQTHKGIDVQAACLACAVEDPESPLPVDPTHPAYIQGQRDAKANREWWQQQVQESDALIRKVEGERDALRADLNMAMGLIERCAAPSAHDRQWFTEQWNRLRREHRNA